MTFLRRVRSAALAAAASVTLAPSLYAAAPTGAGGVVSHLNLVSNHSQDISTLDAWKNTYIKPGMSDQDKTIAIFNTIVRYRHQANPPREFLSSALAGGHVHDPLKSFHVYGYGQCCCAAAEVQGLARYLGLPARGRPVTVHSVAEVFYDDSWHLIDPSVMNYHVKPDGKLASVDEINSAVCAWLEKNPDYAQGEIKDRDKKLRTFAKNGGWKNGPSLLATSDAFYGPHGINSAGWHGWPSTMIEYSKVEEPDEFWATMGYHLNVQLRPGERITRNFFSRGLDYTNKCSPKYYAELLDRKLLGLQSKLGDRAPGRIGDGTTEWTVPLNNPDQLKASALSLDNITPTNGSLSATDPAKPATLVLRFPSSYVYTKGHVILDWARDTRLSGPQAGRVTVSFSDNNGLDYKPLTTFDQAGGQTLDLTPHIQKRYDYRLKFEFTGQGTTLNAIKTANHFQCSQAALPALTDGDNQLTFSAGPPEGTITIEGATNTEAARKNNQLTINDFHPALSNLSESLAMTAPTGSATFPLTTPGDLTRLRISTGWRARHQDDGFQLQVSYDNGQSFHTVDTLKGNTKGESRYTVVSNIPPNTRQAQFRLAGTQKGTTCLFDLRIDADYKEPHAAFHPIKITYTWDESGHPKSHTHTAKTEKETYTIPCGPNTTVKSFTMELAD